MTHGFLSRQVNFHTKICIQTTNKKEMYCRIAAVAVWVTRLAYLVQRAWADRGSDLRGAKIW
jgi:hypothetical protein